MKLSILLSFFTTFIVSLLFSQQPETSLLWEIKGKKVKSPSYLFGTMHLIPKDKFYFPEELQEKVRNSEVLMMEIGGISEQMKAANKMFLSEGSVFDFFSKTQQDSLFNYMKDELGLSESDARARYGRLKPLALMQLMTQNTFGESPESYELRLEMIAKKNGLQIAGLETVEEQMAIFDKIPNSEQAEMIMATVRGQNSETETNRLIELYLAQDIDALAKTITESEGSGFSNFEEDFLTARNKRWIPLIQKAIRKNTCFIAVGAGHLGGPEGVIQLLREAGYTVEPIKF
jgi:uncharacterized protein YbaP (TraB family)